LCKRDGRIHPLEEDDIQKLRDEEIEKYFLENAKHRQR
jgi:hypothetical protein